MRESSRTETSQSPPQVNAPKCWGEQQRNRSSLVIVEKKALEDQPHTQGWVQAPVAPKWVRRVLAGSATALGASSLHCEDVGALFIPAIDK